MKIHIYITILIIIIFFNADLSYAQTWTQSQDQIKQNTQQIDIINGKISDLKDNYRLLYDGAKNQNDQLGNQISFASYLLSGLAFIFTILGVFLAWYINIQSNKVKKLKDDVEAIKKDIDEHATDLYKKLKRAETLDLLRRLENVPEDITNICGLLLSRDLAESDYLYLKTAYIKIKKALQPNGIATHNYIILFMQHFPYESLCDLDLKQDIVTNINLGNLNNFFNRDIKNFFNEVIKYLKEFGVVDEDNKTIIKSLFYFYSKSNHKDDEGLQIYIKEMLNRNEMKTNELAYIIKSRDPSNHLYSDLVNKIFN